MQAENGTLVGLAQVANHKDPELIYAGPMFMGISREIYRKLGSPEMAHNKTEDVAQALTNLAIQNDIPVELIFPSFAIQPKWPLSQHGVFGVGTFYGDQDFFHLFESRRKSGVDLFVAVANGVVSGRHDFGQYLAIMDEVPKKKRKFLGLF